jgi:hypothetical protein
LKEIVFCGIFKIEKRMVMYKGMDRRIFERRDGNLTVRYKIEGEGAEFCTSTKNISGSGMKITLLKNIPLGTMIDLEIFKKNSNQSSRCRGKVIWVSCIDTVDKKDKFFEAGIKFMDSDLMHIGCLISNLETYAFTTNSLN